MSHLLREFELLEPLRARLADGMPAYGSCAGMILLATEILDAGVRRARGRCRWAAIDMTVRRNAFGRQVDSFEERHRLHRTRRARCMRCSSGRRGWNAVGPRCEVLAAAAGHPVAVRQGTDAGDVVSPGDDRRPPRARDVRRLLRVAGRFRGLGGQHVVGDLVGAQAQRADVRVVRSRTSSCRAARNRGGRHGI